jgi:hypothetical protein
MSTQRDDGGPAFPTEVDIEQPEGFQCGNTRYQAYGMSLRDHFAALAMQGASANPMILEWFNKYGEPGMRLCDWLAPAAYGMADAMLRERAK